MSAGDDDILDSMKYSNGAGGLFGVQAPNYEAWTAQLGHQGTINAWNAPSKNHERIITPEKEKELDRILQELKNQVIEVGFHVFKTTGQDISAVEAFNMVLQQIDFNRHDLVELNRKVENFKLK